MNQIDLGGLWRIRRDEADEGLRRRWHEHAPEDGWIEAPVPAAWQHVLGADYHGVAWYRRRVEVPREWLDVRSRVWLRFESVATDCRAWVNGVEIGRHVGDLLPFQFEVPRDAIRGGEIEIILRVDEIHATRPPPGVTLENGHITKGFHDVLSLQHGGVWGGVSLRRTGAFALVPDGASALGDPASGLVHVRVELDAREASGEIEVWVEGCESPVCRTGVAPGQRVVDASFIHPTPQAWTPESPSMAKLDVRVMDAGAAHAISDQTRVRFGFRTVTFGGPNNRNILLNGQPICIRGVLHWGHEPKHIAPAPPAEQIRAEFTRLKQMGFNCVCLCMVYMSREYYDIADEMGMLLWQEHPIWKSRMDRELIPEYQRLCDGFFRRDRRHPSVVIVSASCEHERIHPDLAAWWWKRSKELLPDRLTQIQTAFIGWTNPQQTDLHDEHVYDSCGRWAAFLEDLQPVLDDLPPRPFVMGETVIGTSWADVASFEDYLPASSGPVGQASRLPTSSSDPVGRASRLPPPWWLPKGLPECRDFERRIAQRFGHATLDRFKRDAEHSNIFHRKFQSELFRSCPRHAGWVMNQIRDVPPARLGFMDELDRWRISPDRTQAWLSDAPILLRTPKHLRAFTGPSRQACGVGVSNCGGGDFTGDIHLRISPDDGRERELAVRVACGRGDVAFADFDLALPSVRVPTRVHIRATAMNLRDNAWDVWALPALGDAPPDVVRLEGLPFEPADAVPDFEERAYSSGWGLKATSWRPLLQHPEMVLFKSPLWRFDAPMMRGTRIVLAHKLFPGLVEWMTAGGRVVLLANRSLAGLSTRFVNLWAQCPLIVEGGVLGAGDGAWVRDALPHDLTRRLTRAIPVEAMPMHAGANAAMIVAPGTASAPANADVANIADQVEPIIRLVFTHDRGVPMVMDAAFTTRVGRGMLIATSLDHTEPAGQVLLHRMLSYAAADSSRPSAELDAKLLAAWIE